MTINVDIKERSEGKSNTTVIISGLTVTVGGTNKISGDILEEIAAAIAAVKMYISLKNGKENNNGTKKLRGRMQNGGKKNGKNMLWFKSWLNEITKSFDSNPYRKETLNYFI